LLQRKGPSKARAKALGRRRALGKQRQRPIVCKRSWKGKALRILRKRWFKNLSSKELSELEREGLEHGLKFPVGT
jgi:hypothetical protein